MVHPVTAYLKVFEQINPHADLTDNTGVSYADGEDYSEFGIWN